MRLSKKNFLCILLLILFLGISLRAYKLGHQSLWIDEVLTALSSKGTFYDVVSQTEINTNVPPLYYLIINGVLRLGSQEFFIRFPSLVFGSLSILFFYFVVRNWLGEKIALTGAFLMAISPFHIWYSQEARPYILFLCLALFSLWMMQELIKNDRNKWLKFGFIISTAATFNCHLIATAYLGFTVVYVLLTVPRSKWIQWIPLFAFVILLIIPGLYRMFLLPPDSSADIHRSFKLVELGYAGWTFSTGYSIGPTITELHLPGRIDYVLKHFYIIGPIMLFFTGMFIIGLYKLWKRNSSVFLKIILLFIFPLTFVVLGSIVSTHPFNVRYAILSFPAFILFIAICANDIELKGIRVCIWVIIVLINLFSLTNYFWNDRYHKENTRAAAQFLKTHAPENSLIIGSAPYTIEILKYYLKEKKHLSLLGYPTSGRHIEKPKLPQDMTMIIGNRDHFWLFLSRTFHSDPAGYLRKYCDKKFYRTLELKMNGVELVLYTSTKTLTKKS